MLPAAGKPLLEHLVERLQRVPQLNGIVIATTTKPIDDSILRLSDKLGVAHFRGSEHDVLERVLGAAHAVGADVIVETTADCPLLDPTIVERCVERYFSEQVDYVSNFLQPSYPIGMNTQVFATSVLEEVSRLTKNPIDHEHVSLYIYSHPEKFRLLNVSAPLESARPELRLTLDTIEDYHLISAVFNALYPSKRDFNLTDILTFLDAHPQIASINANVQQKRVRPV